MKTTKFEVVFEEKCLVFTMLKTSRFTYSSLFSSPVFDKKRMERKTQELLSQSSYLNTLYSLNIDSKNFMGKVRDMLTGVCSWAKKFLKPEPHISDDLVDFKLGSEPNVESDVRLAIADVVDIEENVLCPSLGLKGERGRDLM